MTRKQLQKIAAWGLLAMAAFASSGRGARTAQAKSQIVLLGTGTPRADPQRSGPATAIVVNDTPYLG